MYVWGMCGGVWVCLYVSAVTCGIEMDKYNLPLSLPVPEREQQQVNKDEDMARQLQHQYDNKRLEEERDAEMARLLQQQTRQPLDTPHDSNNQPLGSDARLAERLQEEENFRERGQPTSSPPPPMTESDAEMARRLQMEEDRNSVMKYKQEGVAPSDTVPYGSSYSRTQGRNTYQQEGVTPPGTFAYGSSYSHTQGGNTYQQGGVTPPDTVPYGSSYSHTQGRNTYQQGCVTPPGTFAYGSSYSRTPRTYANELPGRYGNDTTEGGDYESHPGPYGVHSNPYSPLYGDDEQPRAKTPPPTRRQKSKNLRGSKSEDSPYNGEEEKIPCQFCQMLIPFAQIMYHQVCCSSTS